MPLLGLLHQALPLFSPERRQLAILQTRMRGRQMVQARSQPHLRVTHPKQQVAVTALMLDSLQPYISCNSRSRQGQPAGQGSSPLLALWWLLPRAGQAKMGTGQGAVCDPVLASSVFR